MLGSTPVSPAAGRVNVTDGCSGALASAFSLRPNRTDIRTSRAAAATTITIATQTIALGLSVAVIVPPLTLPAVIRYYRDGALNGRDLLIALVIAAGFGCGSFFGAKLATSLPKGTLKLTFGFLLVYVAGYTIF